MSTYPHSLEGSTAPGVLQWWLTYPQLHEYGTDKGDFFRAFTFCNAAGKSGYGKTSSRIARTNYLLELFDCMAAERKFQYARCIGNAISYC